MEIKQILKDKDPFVWKDLESSMNKIWHQNTIERPIQDEDVNLDATIEKIHHHIDQMERPPIHSKANLNLILTQTIQVYKQVAAVLLIPLLVFALFLMNNDMFNGRNQHTEYREKPVNSEIVTPTGSRIEMILPDETRVWLNHGSKLKYPGRFDEISRSVYLEGEAYFIIKEDKQRPFLVNTPEIIINATGTSFNVMAYDNEKEIGVSLDEGSVELYKTAQGNQMNQKVCVLKPGEHATYDRIEKNMHIITGRNDIFTAWTNGKMIFRETPLPVIAKRLERWYNVEINLNDEGLNDLTFTATFYDETLQQVLELLSKAAPLACEIKPRQKKEDNSFTKSMVFISLKDNYQS